MNTNDNDHNNHNNHNNMDNSSNQNTNNNSNQNSHNENTNSNSNQNSHNENTNSNSNQNSHNENTNNNSNQNSHNENTNSNSNQNSHNENTNSNSNQNSSNQNTNNNSNQNSHNENTNNNSNQNLPNNNDQNSNNSNNQNLSSQNTNNNVTQNNSNSVQLHDSDKPLANPDVPQEKNTTDDKKPKPSKKKVFSIIGIVFVSLGLIFFCYWAFYSRFYVETEDAYVRGNILSITPRTSGAVFALYKDAPERVEAGKLLLKLDDTDAKLNLELAKANLVKAVQGYCKLQYSSKQLESQLSNANAGISLAEQKVVSSKSGVKQASIHLQNTKREYYRNIALAKKGTITRKSLNSSRDNYNTAKASYNQALAGLESSKLVLLQATAGANGSESQYKSTQVSLGKHISESAEVRLATVNFHNAWLAKHRTNIYSPVAGQIAKRNVEVGEMIQAGTPVMSMVQTSSLWIKANFKETQLSNLRIGQNAEVVIDALGQKSVVHGKVAGVEAGTGTAFSLIPAENATGNWIKIVQRVPVRIEIDNPDELKRLKVGVGFSATVTVDVHDTSGNTLEKVTDKKARFQTDIYKIDTSVIESEEKKIVNDTLLNAGCNE